MIRWLVLVFVTSVFTIALIGASIWAGATSHEDLQEERRDSQ